MAAFGPCHRYTRDRPPVPRLWGAGRRSIGARSRRAVIFSEMSNLADALRAFAFSLPEAWEDHPWGESVAKVGKRVFVFFGATDGDDPFGFSVKLPRSRP